jgi:hypothetical protein
MLQRGSAVSGIQRCAKPNIGAEGEPIVKKRLGVRLAFQNPHIRERHYTTIDSQSQP